MPEHIPVLLNEVIQGLAIKPEGIFVDCTLGGGGHSSEILKRLTTGRLIAFDQDEYALAYARERLEKISPPFTLVHNNFVNLKSELLALGIERVDGILYDLGVSSFQFDLPERGFSYQHDNRLDMRMDQNQTLDAYLVVNNYSESELRRIFYEYGEEKFAPQIARKIVQVRTTQPIETTLQLVDVIKKALPSAILRQPQHPAKKAFQAIRIEVNQELTVLKTALEDALSMLKVGGRVAVITFHSLEDRIVKQLFKAKSTLIAPKGLPYLPEHYQVSYSLVTKKAVQPTDEELAINRRAHSAKLRIIERIKD